MRAPRTDLHLRAGACVGPRVQRFGIAGGVVQLETALEAAAAAATTAAAAAAVATAKAVAVEAEGADKGAAKAAVKAAAEAEAEAEDLAYMPSVKRGDTAGLDEGDIRVLQAVLRRPGVAGRLGGLHIR